MIDYAPYLERWHSQPKEVSLETLARCNAACTFCPYPTLERIGTRMPDQLISRLIREMAEWEVPFDFAPFKLSEPLLDVRLQSICETFSADVPNGTLRLFTNGSPMTRKHLEWIAALPRLHHLWISLNEYRADEYQKLMKMPFDRTAKNLDMLHEMVVAGEFKHPVVLSKVGQDFDFQRYCHVRWPAFERSIIKKDGWLGYVDPDDPTIPDTPCIRWFELSIMADGLASHCCMASGEPAKYNIGDVNKQTLLEIYNSPFWAERRHKLLSRKAVDDRSPCNQCSYGY
jgi:MoaA/NifB/PqqE/SkfB family radical SAM enzyme